jgi:hypothetical protein
MLSRTRRRQIAKRLYCLTMMSGDDRVDEGNAYLEDLTREARRRAGRLGARQAWALAHDPNVQARLKLYDPNGSRGLQADVNRICADSIAEVAGRHLTSGSRPAADRAR